MTMNIQNILLANMLQNRRERRESLLSFSPKKVSNANYDDDHFFGTDSDIDDLVDEVSEASRAFEHAKALMRFGDDNWAVSRPVENTAVAALRNEAYKQAAVTSIVKEAAKQAAAKQDAARQGVVAALAYKQAGTKKAAAKQAVKQAEALMRFATGMNSDEDLGQDIIMKGEPYHYRKRLSDGPRTKKTVGIFDLDNENPWAEIVAQRLDDTLGLSTYSDGRYGHSVAVDKRDLINAPKQRVWGVWGETVEAAGRRLEALTKLQGIEYK